MHRMFRWIVPILVLAALTVPSAASADWQPHYFGPDGTMYAQAGSDIGTSGWNNHVNNRVYRPTGYNFFLGYYNGTYHYSTNNSTDNPFYWAAFGYNFLVCGWSWNGSYPSVYPVTCQGAT